MYIKGFYTIRNESGHTQKFRCIIFNKKLLYLIENSVINNAKMSVTVNYDMFSEEKKNASFKNCNLYTSFNCEKLIMIRVLEIKSKFTQLFK